MHMASPSVVCMGSRIASCIHVLPCPHNEVHVLLGEDASDDGHPIAVNTDIALVDLQGVDLSPRVDVLSVRG
jgi:hypothetical protein